MDTTLKPLNIGVAGFGWWGKIISNFLISSKNFNLIAIADPIEKNLLFNTQGGDSEVDFYEDFESLISDSRLEAVVICTPHLFHGGQILMAADRGLHIFCEKPLCSSTGDVIRALTRCQEKGVTLGVGHERRFEPAVVQIKKEIESGLYGTILQIEGNFSQDKFLDLPKDNWRLSPESAPVGPLTATGIHLVDLSISFLGKPSLVFSRLSSRGAGFRNGDTLAIFIEFESGAVSLLTAILATPFDGRFAIYGSEGWCEIRDMSHPENPSGWRVTRSVRGKDREESYYPAHQSVEDNLESFFKVVRKTGEYPISHEQKLYTVATLEAITESVVSGNVKNVVFS